MVSGVASFFFCCGRNIKTEYINYYVSGHKGRWIGWGGLVMALGSFICALPHWMIEPYDVSDIQSTNTSEFGQCTIRFTLSIPWQGLYRELEGPTCSKSSLSSYLNPYFWIFILGQTLHGFGSTPLFSIGTTFIDENVSQKASPVYLGTIAFLSKNSFIAIHAVLTSFGPVIGVFVGGFLLNIYDDFDRVDVWVKKKKKPHNGFSHHSYSRVANIW